MQFIDLYHVAVVMASLPLAQLIRLRLLLEISLSLWPIRIGTVTAFRLRIGAGVVGVTDAEEDLILECALLGKLLLPHLPFLGLGRSLALWIFLHLALPLVILLRPFLVQG